MNYDTIISAADEYCSQHNAMRRTFPQGFSLYKDTPLHAEKAQRSIYNDKAEHALNLVCEATGIPVGAAINASRIANRYYERGGTKCIDAERLIRSLA